jgi:hypothetical protein
MDFLTLRFRPVVWAAVAAGVAVMACSGPQGRETNSVSAVGSNGFRTSRAVSAAFPAQDANGNARQKWELEHVSECLRQSLRHLKQNLAREESDPSFDSAARFEQVASLKAEIAMIEQRLEKLGSQLNESDRRTTVPREI